ncbi:MAG: hypothetical protein R6X33_09520 [Candidatus Brocadiia bacterium]
MLSQVELLAFLLSLAVAAFILSNHAFLRECVPAWPLFVGAFYLLFVARTATIVEGACWYGLWNTVEHLCQAGSSVLLAGWCWSSLARGRFYDLHRSG